MECKRAEATKLTGRNFKITPELRTRDNNVGHSRAEALMKKINQTPNETFSVAFHSVLIYLTNVTASCTSARLMVSLISFSVRVA